MSLKARFSELAQVPPPVLTAYIDVNPANPRNRGMPRGYLTWLSSTGHDLSQTLTPRARRDFRKQLARIEEYLLMEPPRSRSIVVFAGPHVWEVVPLQVDVNEEMHWGKPSLQQVAWLLDEHQLRGVVLIDGSGARFYRYWLGTVSEDEGAVFKVDMSKWRKPHLVGPSTTVVAKQAGLQRDLVQSRIEAQRKRFIRSLAERIAKWADGLGIEKIFLVGAPEDVEATARELPTPLRSRATLIGKELAHLSPGETLKRLQSELEREERQYEEKLVDDLLSEERADEAALGIDRSLAEIQEGRAREIVVARGLTAALRECVKCRKMDRIADAICAKCGSPRRPRTLRTALPELAAAHGVPVEVVASKAASKLRRVGGIAVRVRTVDDRSGTPKHAGSSPAGARAAP